MALPRLPEHQPADRSADPAAAMRAAMAPRDLGRGVVSAATIVGLPRGPFFLRHHPSCWQISQTLAKPTILPELGIFKIGPGANGCRTRNKDEVADAGYRQALRDMMDQGWTPLDPGRDIPASCLPAGIPGGGYLRAIEGIHAVHGQAITIHREAWDVPSPSPSGMTAWRFDRESYERWLLHLVESGQIKPPTESDLRALQETTESHLMARLERPYATAEVAEIRRSDAKKRHEAATNAQIPKPKARKDAQVEAP